MQHTKNYDDDDYYIPSAKATIFLSVKLQITRPFIEQITEPCTWRDYPTLSEHFP